MSFTTEEERRLKNLAEIDRLKEKRESLRTQQRAELDKLATNMSKRQEFWDSQIREKTRAIQALEHEET